MSDPVVANFDGLCEWANNKRNPGGLACGGWVIKVHPPEFQAVTLGNAAYTVGNGATNNVAEYKAALSVLEVIYKTSWRGPVILLGDSQLVVRQFNGEYACNAILLVPLLERLRKAGKVFERLTLEWVPREQNSEADAQSRLAYKRHTELSNFGF